MTAVGRVAGCVALVLTATAGSSATSQLSLNLNLASSQELSAMSTGAMVAEVNAIWWDSNLSLIWRTAEVSDPLPAMPESENWLRVLVLARQRPGAGETSTFAVGELVRYEGARPLAIASLTSARRVVDEALRFQVPGDARDYDRRLGVVLGRAVAHEIGHYLLGTTHASRGLMRANIDALEFADVRSRAFRLDHASQTHLARLASSAQSQVPIFSYAAR